MSEKRLVGTTTGAAPKVQVDFAGQRSRLVKQAFCRIFPVIFVCSEDFGPHLAALHCAHGIQSTCLVERIRSCDAKGLETWLNSRVAPSK